MYEYYEVVELSMDELIGKKCGCGNTHPDYYWKSQTIVNYCGIVYALPCAFNKALSIITELQSQVPKKETNGWTSWK